MVPRGSLILPLLQTMILYLHEIYAILINAGRVVNE